MQRVNKILVFKYLDNTTHHPPSLTDSLAHTIECAQTDPLPLASEPWASPVLTRRVRGIRTRILTPVASGVLSGVRAAHGRNSQTTARTRSVSIPPGILPAAHSTGLMLVVEVRLAAGSQPVGVDALTDGTAALSDLGPRALISEPAAHAVAID